MAGAGGNASEKGHEVLWSIYAELIYYTIYPLLFLAAKRVGWGALIVCSGAISIALVLLHSNYSHVQQFGWLTWLWGLPIWLSGCVLAERLHSGWIDKLSGNRWWWRFSAWGFGVLAILGVFHSKTLIGYPISMLLFAGFAYPWLAKELGERSPAWSWLERFGRASYSLYLVHNIILGAITDYFPHPSSFGIFLLSWVAIGTGTYVFYKLVEHPSHSLARHVAQMLPRHLIDRQSLGRRLRQLWIGKKEAAR